jgi:ribosomal protein L36
MKEKRPSKIKIIFLTAFIIFAGLYAIIPNNYLSLLTDIPKTMKLIASVRAKDFCSCYLAQGLSKTYCQNWANKGLPEFISPISVNNEKNTVTSGHYIKVQASYKGMPYGCQIITEN